MSTCTLLPTWRATGTGIWIILVTSNESIIEKYLGRDYRIAGGAKYTILEDNIGYIYYGDFSSGIGNGNLDEILLYLSACNGLIIDVRNNGGGNLTNATEWHNASRMKK